MEDWDTKTSELLMSREVSGVQDDSLETAIGNSVVGEEDDQVSGTGGRQLAMRSGVSGPSMIAESVLLVPSICRPRSHLLASLPAPRFALALSVF